MLLPNLCFSPSLQQTVQEGIKRLRKVDMLEGLYYVSQKTHQRMHPMRGHTSHQAIKVY